MSYDTYDTDDVPDSLIVFMAWKLEDGMEFRSFINSDESLSTLNRRVAIKKAWIELNGFIDKMNSEMVNDGDMELLSPLEIDMVEWLCTRRRN